MNSALRAAYARGLRAGALLQRSRTLQYTTHTAQVKTAKSVNQTWESATAKNPAFAVSRELPGPKSRKKEIAIFVAVAAVTWGAGTMIAFNYERMTSTPVTAALFTARHNPDIQDKLGSQLNFTSAFPWIKGSISHLKGFVDVEFDVVGAKGIVGHLVLKSRRSSAKQNGEWDTIAFYVETEDGTKINCS